MTTATNWLRQTRRTYFGNAAAQRDFRVQLRGNRSMLLFGLYLAILIVLGYFKYSEIESNTSISVVQAQRELRGFYELIVMLLAGMVSVVTPGLAATAIVLERQRRSLDLVFSAPVAPRYYLVGKIIAVYRYIWMLLILSLPVTAACVVLGGASWSDVLTVYGLLSIHGLLFAAIGLMMSTICAKPVSAVIWTYAAVILYLSLSGSVAGAGYAIRSGYGAGSVSEVPFYIGLNPFSALYTVGTYTVIWGYHVPNWSLASLVLLIVVRLCLLGAGSLLSDGRETVNLRLNWIFVAGIVSFGLACWMATSGQYRQMTDVSHYTADYNPFRHADPQAVVLGYALFWATTPLAFVLPSLAAYGADAAQRNRPNGSFSVRRALDGSPAGGLPYVLALVMIVGVAGIAGIAMGGGPLPGPTLVAYVLFTIGFWSLFWAITRTASSYGVGVKAARTTVVAAMVVLVILPVPFLSALSADTFGEPGISLWDLYLLRPVLQFREVHAAQALVYGVGMLILALALAAWSERNWRDRGSAVRA